MNFSRNWTEYRDGFGELTGEFWLGNEKLRQITSEGGWLLQVDLQFDEGVNWTKPTSYQRPFRIEGDSYTLRVEGLAGMITIQCFDLFIWLQFGQLVIIQVKLLLHF